MDENTTNQPARSLTEDEIKAMSYRRADARTEISRLCGGERWRMSIPVQPYDSDEVFGRVIDDAERLEREVYLLRITLREVYVCLKTGEDVALGKLIEKALWNYSPSADPDAAAKSE